jgi:hypothetical protein
MGVVVENPGDAVRVKAQTTDGLEKEIDGLGEPCVQENQALSGVDQVGRDIPVSDVIQVSSDTEGLDSEFPGMGIDSARH